MMKRNLVMGAVSGYSFDQLRPFITSLQQTSFTGDIVILYTDLSPDTLNSLTEHNVIVRPLRYRGKGAVNSWSRFWKHVKPGMPVLKLFGLHRFAMKMLTPLQTSRFFGYNDFLKKHRTHYANVLLTDIRDVIFQDDPFRRFEYQKLQCFEEDLIMREETRFNLPWIQTLFGPDAADSFLDCQVVCSGTIMGKTEVMITYLDAYEKQLSKAVNIGEAGSDQGLHNLMVRTLYKANSNVVPNGTAEVLTVTASNLYRYKVDKAGRFIDINDNVIPVIHQYDRSPELKQRLQSTLAS